MKFTCEDCGGDIYFERYELTRPIISYCTCEDRDTHIDKFGGIRKNRIIDHRLPIRRKTMESNKIENLNKIESIKDAKAFNVWCRNANNSFWFSYDNTVKVIHFDETFIIFLNSGGIERYKYISLEDPFKETPKSNYRPFKNMSEVPTNAWFRVKNKSFSAYKSITQWDCNNVWLSFDSGVGRTFEDLFEKFDMSTDFGGINTPAGVKL